MSETAQLESDLREYRLQLETVQSSLQADPDNTELENLKAELEEAISITEGAVADLRPTLNTQATKKASPPPVKEKWSKENHPAYKAGYRPPNTPTTPLTPAETEPQTPVTYSVNDAVLAKWKSGDKAYYHAKITSITGSAAKPIYIVTFKAYGTTETLMAHEIKPLSNPLKRKADSQGGSQPSTPTTPATPNAPSNVISAPANIDSTLAEARRAEPSRAADGLSRPPKVPRKVKANKELEAGKKSWQDFAQKAKTGKSGKKDSMFRTGDGTTARVGFTGSGQGMRKDAPRTRHVYQSGEGED